MHLILECPIAELPALTNEEGAPSAVHQFALVHFERQAANGRDFAVATLE